MAVSSVKITELEPANKLAEDDMFLISKELAVGDKKPYKSKKLSFSVFWKNLVDKIIHEIFEHLQTEKTDGNDNNSVINIGFLKGQHKWPDNFIMPSYVGMIIHSTTLNSLAAVQKQYGESTNWRQLTGDYVLKPANGKHPAITNSNKKDDGANDVWENAENVTSYKFNMDVSGELKGSTSKESSGVKVVFHEGVVKNHNPTHHVVDWEGTSFHDNKHAHSVTIDASGIKNMIKFNSNATKPTKPIDLHVAAKYVYIWERVK